MGPQKLDIQLCLGSIPGRIIYGGQSEQSSEWEWFIEGSGHQWNDCHLGSEASQSEYSHEWQENNYQWHGQPAERHDQDGLSIS